MARFAVIVLLLFAAAPLLQGCDRVGPPAPYELHGAGSLDPDEPAIPHPDSIIVGGAATLYGVSRRYGVPMRAIIDANHLTPPFRLIAGTRLRLPHVRTHVVRPGDTLTSVARRFGVDVSTLARTNHLGPPYIIRTGTVLVLPAAVEAAPPPQIARTASPPVVPSPVAPPPVAPPVAIAGLPRRAPASSPPSAVPSRPAPRATQTPEIAVAPRRFLPRATPPREPAPAPAAIAAAPPPLHLPIASGSGFIWPVRGRIIEAFGTTPQGLKNDGINIAAPEGTPVLAAASGEVAYAGNELRGYGNLILIKHPNGYITAYAHNETLLVRRGEHVRRGEPIARVGATGAVSTPQLHFELRRGTRAVDPTNYLPAETASAH